jgi:hypothetical protein
VLSLLFAGVAASTGSTAATFLRPLPNHVYVDDLLAAGGSASVDVNGTTVSPSAQPVLVFVHERPLVPSVANTLTVVAQGDAPGAGVASIQIEDVTPNPLALGTMTTPTGGACSVAYPGLPSSQTLTCTYTVSPWSSFVSSITLRVTVTDGNGGVAVQDINPLVVNA